MAKSDKDKLAERLLSRFKDVPNVELTDALEWIELSMNEHGFNAEDDVPPEMMSLILMYAEADGASQIALRTAYYFKFTDKDETVDKSAVPEQYRKLADALWKRYRQKKEEGVDGYGGARTSFMRRVDR